MLSALGSPLWFGDERGYNATRHLEVTFAHRCGLVMKEDITQRVRFVRRCSQSCGLVMKEDITQHKNDSMIVRTGVVW